MPNTPDRNHRITMEAGRALIERHQRNEHKKLTAVRSAEPTHAAKQPIAHSYSIDQLIEFATAAKEKGASTMRFYLGAKEDGQQTLVGAGAGKDGSLIAGDMMDMSYPCPPTCNDPEFLSGPTAG